MEIRLIKFSSASVHHNLSEVADGVSKLFPVTSLDFWGFLSHISICNAICYKIIVSCF